MNADCTFNTDSDCVDDYQSRLYGLRFLKLKTNNYVCVIAWKHLVWFIHWWEVALTDCDYLPVLCSSDPGGEGAGPPRTEHVHTAPHTGLLRPGRSGSAARPGETLRDDPEEEEDASTQQEEEMRRRTLPLLVLDLILWPTTCLRTSAVMTDTIGRKSVSPS